VGLFYLIILNYTERNTTFSDKCSSVIDMSEGDLQIVDRIFTLNNPVEGQINLKWVITIVIFQSTLATFVMLERTQYLGD